MSLHSRIVCFCLMNMKYVIVISNLHFFCSLFPFFFSSFICPCIPADALESLRQSCETVCPNDGFLEQVILTLH